MAGCAGVELGRHQLLGAAGDAGYCVHFPMAVICRLQPVGKAFLGVVYACGIGAAFGSRLGPGNVARAGAVTGLAGYVDIGPAGRIRVGGEVVILFQIGRVAILALVVPGLIAAGPVQPVSGSELLVGIKVKPTLATLFLRPAVPSNAERLILSSGKSDQVLLEGIDPKGIGDLIIVERAVRP